MAKRNHSSKRGPQARMRRGKTVTSTSNENGDVFEFGDEVSVLSRSTVGLSDRVSKELDSIKSPKQIRVRDKSKITRRQKKNHERPQPLDVAQARQEGINPAAFHRKGQRTHPAQECRPDGVPMAAIPRKPKGWREQGDAVSSSLIQHSTSSSRNKPPAAAANRRRGGDGDNGLLSTFSRTASDATSAITSGLRKAFSPPKPSHYDIRSSVSDGKDKEVVDLCSHEDDDDDDDVDACSENYQEGDTTITEHLDDDDDDVDSSSAGAHSTPPTSSRRLERNVSTSSSSSESLFSQPPSSRVAAAASRNDNDDDSSINEVQVVSSSTRRPMTSINRFLPPEGTSDLFPDASVQEEDKRSNVCGILNDIGDEPFNGSVAKKPRTNKTGNARKSRTSKIASKKAPSKTVGPSSSWGHSSLKGEGQGSIPQLSITKVNAPKGKKKKMATRIIPGSTFRHSSPEDTDPIKSSDDDDDDYDLEPSTTSRTRKHAARSGSQPNRHGLRPSLSRNAKKPRSPVVDLQDTDDEDCTTLAQLASTVSATRKDVVALRIAIGKKVFSKRCLVRYVRNPKSGTLELSYDGPNGRRSHRIDLDDASIEELKYFLAGDDETITIDFDESEKITFLAMKIKPNEQNGLTQFPNAYVPSSTNESDASRSKRYIAIEFRSDADLKSLLRAVDKDAALCGFVTEHSRIRETDIVTYGSLLFGEAMKERKTRESSIGSPRARRSKRKKRGSNKPNDVMVVFPFGADESKIDKAAEGLNEVGRGTENSTIGRESADDDRKMPAISSNIPENPEEGKEAPSDKKNSRAHFLAIHDEDYDRLQPGEFLNDTLIDFFFQWIWRKEENADSDVHFFTSHFYSTLHKRGLEAVTSWTRKKNIDVFKKKFVFIPINQSLHWSLCVVVNPGEIMNAILHGVEKPDDLLMPCILFFDSLKAHRKSMVAKKIREWLNSEWQWLKTKSDSVLYQSPFNPKTMKVYDPRVPYQDNSWDCGVFVCRYGFAIYLFRDRKITYGDCYHEGDSSPFQTFITDSDEFTFDRNDIVRMRNELATLLERLSVLYKEWKEFNEEADKLEEESKKSADVTKDVSEAAGREETGITANVTEDAEDSKTLAAVANDMSKSAEREETGNTSDVTEDVEMVELAEESKRSAAVAGDLSESADPEETGNTNNVTEVVEMADADVDEDMPDAETTATEGKKKLLSPVKMEEDQFDTIG